MPCHRCRPIRDYEMLEDAQENYMFLSGVVQQPFKYFNPYDQCFCRDQRLLEQERLKTGIEIPGKCYPTDMCTNCDLNYSGLCPQQNKLDSGIYIDEIPVYPVIPPYVRPAYYPYSPWYPHSPYRPHWYPNGYRPRPDNRPPHRPWSPRPIPDGSATIQPRPSGGGGRGSLGPGRGSGGRR